MVNWLTTIPDVLDRAEQPVRLFFRDDDAGWENDKLYALLDEFALAGFPIDLAVIPEALDHNLADELLSRQQQAQRLIGLHQHGYSHTNHEPIGRKCEFGNSRTKSQKKDDIAKGQKRLREAFGNALDPIFTPPWNRCAQDTVECLEELDFCLLSRDAAAAGLESSTLKQMPIHVDWSRMIKKSSDPLPEFGKAIATNLQNNELTGIMLHHADMDGGNLQALAELLAVFAEHNNVQGLLLRESLG
jgi:predicted deacetylase